MRCLDFLETTLSVHPSESEKSYRTHDGTLSWAVASLVKWASLQSLKPPQGSCKSVVELITGLQGTGVSSLSRKNRMRFE